MERVSDEIIEIIEYLSEKFGIAYETAENELFPRIKEIGDKLINYEICTSVVWIVVSIAGIILSAIVSIKLYKKAIYKSNSDYGEFWLPTFIFFLIVAVFAFFTFSIALITQILDIIECTTFPEKYILDYIMNYTPNKQ